MLGRGKLARRVGDSLEITIECTAPSTPSVIALLELWVADNIIIYYKERLVEWSATTPSFPLADMSHHGPQCDLTPITHYFLKIKIKCQSELESKSECPEQVVE